MYLRHLSDAESARQGLNAMPFEIPNNAPGHNNDHTKSIPKKGDVCKHTKHPSAVY